jgi:hypothetical protein
MFQKLKKQIIRIIAVVNSEAPATPEKSFVQSMAGAYGKRLPGARPYTRNVGGFRDARDTRPVEFPRISLW